MRKSSAMTILLWLTAMLGNPAAALAQTYWVSSVTTTDLGRVAAAASGTTTFRIDADTGVVTKLSGAGARITTANAYTIAVLNCGAQNACNTANARVSIASGGTPVNRAITLQNFTVSTGSATLLSSPSPGSPITFDIGPIGRSSNKTISIGFDFGVKGDNSGSPSGLSSAQFEVIVSRPNGSNGGALFSTAQAFVSRSLSVTKTADLAFGRIARPSSGSGTVQLNQATGAVTVTGTGTLALPSPVPSAAIFNVSGEGGQSVSVTVPASVTLTSPAGSLVVATTTNAAGAQILSGSAGSAGSLAVRVGGSLPISSSTPIGNYTGIFAVTVQYN